MTADLHGGEQGFLFPICPWIMWATKMLILPWLDTLLPANNFRRILAFLVFFQDSTSSFQKIVLPTLCPGWFKVQPAGPLSMQQLCEDKDDQLPAFIACELLVSNF